MRISITVNGRAVALEAAPLRRLLDILRDDLGLTGTKEGCGEGECGACAVLMNGLLVNSCLVPAMQCDGADVRTIEGLGRTDAPDPIQESFVEEGTAIKSLSIAFRADGDLGFSFVFPFFIVKHLTDPMTGGYIVQRMYLKDHGLQDFGWMAMYMPSASRWMDTYLAAGAEKDATVDSLGVKTSEWDFVFETGLKFRVNMQHSPLKFLSVLTPYWGLRAGIKNRGFFDINRLTYVFEIGAGSF